LSLLLVTEQKFTDLQNTFSIIKLICENSQGSVEVSKVGFVYKIREAINHIFRVGTGLE
jgi:glutamyl-tRNA reductase